MFEDWKRLWKRQMLEDRPKRDTKEKWIIWWYWLRCRHGIGWVEWINSWASWLPDQYAECKCTPDIPPLAMSNLGGKLILYHILPFCQYRHGIKNYQQIPIRFTACMVNCIICYNPVRFVKPLHETSITIQIIIQSNNKYHIQFPSRCTSISPVILNHAFPALPSTSSRFAYIMYIPCADQQSIPVNPLCFNGLQPFWKKFEKKCWHWCTNVLQ